MTTDYRALCAELLDEWDAASGDPDLISFAIAITRVRTALAQPELQGPTDEDLLDAHDQAVAAFPPIHPEAEPLSVVEYARELEIRKARAVLARFGRPAIEPVPIAERLPGPEDCDADGECWWWHPDHKEDEFSDGWMLLKPKWADGHHDRDDSPVHTHWLPHYALPVVILTGLV